MWGVLKFLFNRNVLLALGALIALAGMYAGVHSIRTAYSERAALRTQVTMDQTDLARERRQHGADVDAANKATAELKSELDLRDALAQQASERHQKTEKDLRNAQSKLALWRSQADANLTACLSTPLPGGLFDQPAETGPAAAAGKN